MESRIKKDSSYLKDDYYYGFCEISSALNSGVIQKSFKKEVEEDILELFIRNQDNNKDFNEVIGGDIKQFIRSIVDVYLDETPIKIKVLNSISCGLIIAAIFLGVDWFTHGKCTSANIIVSAMVMVVVSLVTFLSYKISKKINPKNTNYIAGLVGLILSLFGDFIYHNVAFFKELSKYEININLAIGLIITMLITAFILIKKMNNINPKED